MFSETSLSTGREWQWDSEICLFFAALNNNTWCQQERKTLYLLCLHILTLPSICAACSLHIHSRQCQQWGFPVGFFGLLLGSWPQVFTAFLSFWEVTSPALAWWVRVILEFPAWEIWDNFPSSPWVFLLSDMNSSWLMGISSGQHCSVSLPLSQILLSSALHIKTSLTDWSLSSSLYCTPSLDMLVTVFRLLVSHGPWKTSYKQVPMAKEMVYFPHPPWGLQGEMVESCRRVPDSREFVEGTGKKKN